MQELRLVLIIVGGLAIAGLLVHGIWTSKKEGKAKFGDRPSNKLDPKLDTALDDDADEGIVSHAKPVGAKTAAPVSKERKEPAFNAVEDEDDDDPLFGSATQSSFSDKPADKFSAIPSDDEDEPVVATQAEPKFESTEQPSHIQNQEQEPEPMTLNTNMDSFNASSETQPQFIQPQGLSQPLTQPEPQPEPEPEPEPEMEVIVFHVHAAGNHEFAGTELFPVMQAHGLVYGAMDIFHRHVEPDGTGKIIFSVANMMKPGNLKHYDPAEFSTKGISFFMTLPCVGDAEQNYKLMLSTAQRIADSLGANVLDDKRNLMTPNRLAAYSQQVRDFMKRNPKAE
ncbi:MAG: cell division protein ZipA [Vibrio sp.]